jgi:hypothetical protein
LTIESDLKLLRGTDCVLRASCERMVHALEWLGMQDTGCVLRDARWGAEKGTEFSQIVRISADKCGFWEK